jgi:hypothetical protein
MIHLYAFADDLQALPAVPGLAGAPLERIDVDGVVAIFSRHETGELGETRDLALAHGTVIGALDGDTEAVLPVRFGERFGDVEHLRAAVRGRRAELDEAFARVRGCAEIGLRVLGTAPVDRQPVASGVDYMRRLHASDASSRVTQDLHRELERLSRDARITSGLGDRLRAAYLVPRSRLEEVRQVVETWTAEHPDVSLVCTGPWAPYSFASEAA